LIFGAGGAARAIAVELALSGAKQITIVNRSAERGEILVQLLNSKTTTNTDFKAWEGDYSIPAETDIVVNSTSIGLYPNIDAKLAVDLDTLQPHHVVADVIPNPPRTQFIMDAESKGCRVLDGLGMLVNQGVIGIKYWTGVDVDPAVMRDKLRELFSGT
jgi:shikimate dehydrogenase